MIQSELALAMMRSHRLIDGKILNHTDWAIANNKAINSILSKLSLGGSSIFSSNKSIEFIIELNEVPSSIMSLSLIMHLT